MSHEENNHSKQLLLFPAKDCISLRELADGGMLVFGGVGSGKTSMTSAQFARFIEDNPAFSGLVMTHKAPATGEEA